MAKSQEKRAFVNSTSPIMEHEQEGNDNYEETGWGCFRIFCCFERRGGEDDGRHLLRQEQGETWLANKLRPVKEASEVLAGPTWKNFIRRVGKYFGKKRSTQFQYDPHSYALNFDDGIDDDEDDPFSGEERRPGLL